MRKNKLILLLVLSTAVSVITALFFAFVADTVTVYADTASTQGRADVIVVLTGGKNRIHEGLTLLREGRASTLILSGVDPDAGLDSIFFKQLLPDEREKIILEKRSKSTYENAEEAGNLIKERGFKSMVLVTSVYHIKRAEFIFRHMLGSDVVIATYPVATPNFDEKRWYRHKSLARLIEEFLKYSWYRVRFASGF